MQNKLLEQGENYYRPDSAIPSSSSNAGFKCTSTHGVVIHVVLLDWCCGPVPISVPLLLLVIWTSPPVIPTPCLFPISLLMILFGKPITTLSLRTVEVTVRTSFPICDKLLPIKFAAVSYSDSKTYSRQ